MNKTKKIIIAVLIFVGGAFAASGIAQDIKLNPIKPGSKATVQISDEQQAILAVRTAKASVVSVVGVSPPAPKPAPGSFSITQPPVSLSGTGFVLEADGLIVTNNHVVEQTGINYSVILADGTEYPATVTSKDKYDDIAFLKIEAKNLTPAKLGDSDALETGQTVFAIGNSLGKYQSSVTRGVVSGLGRAVNEGAFNSLPTLHNWIQTDAAISPGNSGGPLINLAGEVVGINTLMDTEGQALGFALPVNSLKEALAQVKAFGKVSRPLLGIQFETIDAALKLEKNLQVSQGALIVTVAGGGAAASGGVQVNDIVVAVNGKDLNKINTLDALVQKYQPGMQITLKILRNGQTLDLPVILGEYK